MSYYPQIASATNQGVFSLSSSYFTFSNGTREIASTVARGTLRYVSEQTISSGGSVASITFSIDDSYNAYHLYLHDVLASTSATLQGQWMTNNSSSYVTSYTIKNTLGSTSSSSASFGMGTLSSNYSTSGIVKLYNTASATSYKSAQVETCSKTAASMNYVYNLVTSNSDTLAINSIQLTPSTGTLSRGLFVLYGVADS